jgi:membrane protein DedA with SNARE-associated domain
MLDLKVPVADHVDRPGGHLPGVALEILQNFVTDYLTPFGGNPHFGLFLFVWLFSAFNPLAPPEEAFTLLGGACMAGGFLEPFWGGLALIAGIVVTNISQYWMGRGVLKLFSGTRWGKKFIGSRSFKNASGKMRDKGIWAIIGCRFFFGTRAPTYVASGFLRYPFTKFVAVDSSMVVVHAVPLMIIGYVFSNQIDSVIHFMEDLGIWSLVLLLALIGAFFGTKYLKNRKARELEA